MKMLMFHVRAFRYRTHERNLDQAPDRSGERGELDGGGILAWVQVEKSDLEKGPASIKRTTKNLKWHARKVGATSIMIHSFAHLGGDTAPADESEDFIREVVGRLESVDYCVKQTPWGHFNEFEMHVEGPGIAKVFISF